MTNAIRAGAVRGVAPDTNEGARHPLTPRPYFNGVYLPSGGTEARIPVVIFAAARTEAADVAIELVHDVDVPIEAGQTASAEEIVVRIYRVDALRAGTTEQQCSAAVAVASWIQRVLEPLPRTGRSTVSHVGDDAGERDAQSNGSDALAPLLGIR